MFVCALLVACMGYEHTDDTDFVEAGIRSLIRLTESAIALGEEASQLALEMLTWFADQKKLPDVYPFACFCVVRLRMHLGQGDAAELRAWVEEKEAKAATALGPGYLWGDQWLARLSVYAETDCAKWAWAS